MAKNKNNGGNNIIQLDPEAKENETPNTAEGEATEMQAGGAATAGPIEPEETAKLQESKNDESPEQPDNKADDKKVPDGTAVNAEADKAPEEIAAEKADGDAKAMGAKFKYSFVFAETMSNQRYTSTVYGPTDDEASAFASALSSLLKANKGKTFRYLQQFKKEAL